MAYATGMRVSELCHVKLSDLEWDRQLIKVIQGKGGLPTRRIRKALLFD
jgi:site-specific recombinase XerD